METYSQHYQDWCETLLPLSLQSHNVGNMIQDVASRQLQADVNGLRNKKLLIAGYLKTFPEKYETQFLIRREDLEKNIAK